MEDIKVGDCVQLKNGYTPKYTVSKILDEMATCVHYDPKSRKTITEQIPLNVLKVYVEPPPIDLSSMFPKYSL